MSITFATSNSNAISTAVVSVDDFPSWLSEQNERTKGWINSFGFIGGLGQAVVLPNDDGTIGGAVLGYGTKATRARGRFHLAAAAAKLPAGVYDIQSGVPYEALETETIGWLLGQYRFDRYKAKAAAKAELICPKDVDANRVEAIVAGEILTRDLINTPSSDMGPDELEQSLSAVAKEFGASTEIILDQELLDQNFPMIHTVGRASNRRPRLLDMRWGTEGPKITLVGKGVCFDTGGLNIKPGGSMGLMKKDMGGAAAVLGLAKMIMGLGLNVQLRVLIPAVENAIDGSAFRPQDVLTSRKGLTVEINNTDAEGRLVLADALTYADEDNPDIIVSMATLTGAARVAVGPDLAPYYSDDIAMVEALENGAANVADPVWRMPFYEPYEGMIEPDVADLDNAPKGGFAGSITAALFLRRFVENPRYMHFDIYGWQPAAAPARPKGGVGQATRALLDVFSNMLDV